MSNLCRADGTPANSRGPFTKGNMMETKDYLSYIVHEIHRTIVATVDDEGLPVTAAIDMMDCDDDSLYFLTAMIKRGFLAFTAMKGEDTMSTVAVSIRGKVRDLGYDRIPVSPFISSRSIVFTAVIA